MTAFKPQPTCICEKWEGTNVSQSSISQWLPWNPSQSASVGSERGYQCFTIISISMTALKPQAICMCGKWERIPIFHNQYLNDYLETPASLYVWKLRERVPMSRKDRNISMTTLKAQPTCKCGKWGRGYRCRARTEISAGTGTFPSAMTPKDWLIMADMATVLVGIYLCMILLWYCSA